MALRHMFFKEYPGWSRRDYLEAPKREIDALMKIVEIKHEIVGSRQRMATVTAEAKAKPAAWG